MDVKRAAIASLAAYAEDSEGDSDNETEGQDGIGLVSSSYGDELVHLSDHGEMEGENAEEKKLAQEMVASFSDKVRHMSTEELSLPVEPPGHCPVHVQDKIRTLYEKKLRHGLDPNRMIQMKKEFRNPSIYEKLIQYCGIDEFGTNYPKDMFNPHGWSDDSYYEALANTCCFFHSPQARSQKLEMDRLEKAKKERTKIEFVTGTKKSAPASTSATTSSTTTSTTDPQKRKSKWDSAVPLGSAPKIPMPPLMVTTASLSNNALTVVSSVPAGPMLATTTSKTVISAIGAIRKNKP
uniref:SAP30-binding protein isoform X2 n=1 Tax=Myxine glutinosa TaxID=7769 RepID=UPI00358E5442